MSTAVMEKIIERPEKLELAAIGSDPGTKEEAFSDPYPLLPVLIAIGISLAASCIFIGSIIVWIGLRHSGVMAP